MSRLYKDRILATRVSFAFISKTKQRSAYFIPVELDFLVKKIGSTIASVIKIASTAINIKARIHLFPVD